MSVCRFCGQDVRGFCDAHEAECERKAREEREERLENEEAHRSVEEIKQWASKRQNLLEKFYEIAERRIFLDEYGTENWEGVFKEAEKFLVRAAESDGESQTTIASIKKAFAKRGSVFMGDLPKNYSTRFFHMHLRFRMYRASQKARAANLDLNAQSGTEFETYLAGVLKQEGFEDICGTPKTGDQGADLIAKKNGRRIVIQAKRYKGSVGNEAVQEVVAAVRFYGGDEGWVITSGTFTPSAKALAQRNSVRLIDGAALKRKDFGGLSYQPDNVPD